MKLVYVVWDNVALAVIGTLMVFAHDAAAVREFTEACANPESLGRRVKDYDLWCLGTLLQEKDGPSITLSSDNITPRCVLTGSALQAMQSPQLELAREA